MASDSLHEDPEKLGPAVIDRHRAIVSLMEELEAVDWYDQRAAATTDESLKALLQHNRDEEKEHAAMMVEWLRRNDPGFAKQLKTYLFTEGSIVGREKAATNGEAGGQAVVDGGIGIGIGSLRKEIK